MPEATETPAATPSPATPPAAPVVEAPATPAAPAVPEAKPPEPTLLTKEVSPPPAAEEIKVKFPEGVATDEALLGKFLPIAKELGLKSDGAQKLVDLFAETQAAAQTRHMEQITQWAEQAKADKEIGGPAFDANLAVAKKALDRLSSPGLKEMLIKTGLGNHPDMIRAFVKVGKLISEDRLPGGGASQEAGPSREDLIKEAFPASPQMLQK